MSGKQVLLTRIDALEAHLAELRAERDRLREPDGFKHYVADMQQRIDVVTRRAESAEAALTQAQEKAARYLPLRSPTGA